MASSRPGATPLPTPPLLNARPHAPPFASVLSLTGHPLPPAPGSVDGKTELAARAGGAHARLVRLRLHDLRRLGQFVLARRMPLMIRRLRSSAPTPPVVAASAAARTVATSGRAPGRAPFSSTAGTSRHGRRARSSSWGATQGIMTTSGPRFATFSQGPLNPVFASSRLRLNCLCPPRTGFLRECRNIRWEPTGNLAPKFRENFATNPLARAREESKFFSGT